MRVQIKWWCTTVYWTGKRLSFYQAISRVMPELQNIYLIRRQTSFKEINLDKIKSLITQIEVEKKVK